MQHATFTLYKIMLLLAEDIYMPNAWKVREAHLSQKQLAEISGSLFSPTERRGGNKEIVNFARKII